MKYFIVRMLYGIILEYTIHFLIPSFIIPDPEIDSENFTKPRTYIREYVIHSISMA